MFLSFWASLKVLGLLKHFCLVLFGKFKSAVGDGSRWIKMGPIFVGEMGCREVFQHVFFV